MSLEIYEIKDRGTDPVLLESASRNSSGSQIQRTLPSGVYWARVGTYFSGSTPYSLFLGRDFESQAPFLVDPPVGIRTQPGESATFRVIADGSPLLKYLWKLDGREVVGAPTNVLTVDAGTMVEGTHRVSVIVQNDFGKVESDPVIWAVGQPLEPQRLEISRSGGRAVFISWPWLAGADPILESAPAPGGPWVEENLPIVGVGDAFKVEVPLSFNQRFLRVRQ